MSLDEFFAKKGKKKSKNKISTQELFEQISDNTLPQKVEAEKIPDLSAVVAQAENEDWEPIVNEDVDLDLSTMRIGDLSVKTEQEQAVTDSLDAPNKGDDGRVVWGGKSTTESVETAEPEEPVEKPAEPAKPGLYVPVYMRSGGARVTNRQAQPNIESIEEFPTLDAVQEKPKKVKNPVKAEVDDSWNEVSKASQGHRPDPPSHVYTPPVLRQGSELKPHKYPSSSNYSQNLEQRYGGMTPRDSFQSSTQSWVRGEAHSTSSSQPSTEQANSSGWVRGVPQSHLTSKPYQIPLQRDIMEFPQENRFARLGDT
uniref:Protein CDV3 homolog n=1 Tax=Schistocephalus solidus TaxID=70667 RepID=A0A0X3NVB9_SCHSO